MSRSLSGALAHGFLGQSPLWYKAVICLFLVLNPLLLVTVARLQPAGRWCSNSSSPWAWR
ncbi:sodium/proton antiporter [Pseudomonas putida]|nr:sodium/proton antiporter [Pseudomonas putida]